MTTVVYRDGVLAAETRIMHGCTVLPGKVRKIHKLPCGSLYGFCGLLEAGELMRRALITPEIELPNLTNDNYEGLVLDHTGKVLVFENRIWMEIDVPYVAMGSGRDFAYGAMAVGASAKQAVKVAMSLDGCSGGRVQTLTWPWWEENIEGRSYAEQVFDE